MKDLLFYFLTMTLAPHPINFTREVVKLPDGSRYEVTFDGTTPRIRKMESAGAVIEELLAILAGCWALVLVGFLLTGYWEWFIRGAMLFTAFLILLKLTVGKRKK